NIGLRNGNDEGGNKNGNGNGNGGGNRNGNHNENDIDARPVVRECTYQDFMKCQPLNFKGTKGVVELIRWFEKMETVFHISNCLDKYQVKEIIKLMAEVYYPRTEIQKMEFELWFPKRRIELRSLLEVSRIDNIQGNVIAAEPTRLQDAVRMANNLMDQKLKGYAMKNDENKRKFDNNQKDNRRQQPPFKRQNVRGHNVARAYTAGNNSRIGEARGKAYVLGGGDANLDSNVVTGMFLLNNHYASVLFDSEDDQSFV
ncbi:hypothetical protein Tco_0082453, partial [Tanacetum coccineum]